MSYVLNRWEPENAAFWQQEGRRVASAILSQYRWWNGTATTDSRARICLPRRASVRRCTATRVRRQLAWHSAPTDFAWARPLGRCCRRFARVVPLTPAPKMTSGKFSFR